MKGAVCEFGKEAKEIISGAASIFDRIEGYMAEHAEQLALISSLIQKASTGDQIEGLSRDETLALGRLIEIWLGDHKGIIDEILSAPEALLVEAAAVIDLIEQLPPEEAIRRAEHEISILGDIIPEFHPVAPALIRRLRGQTEKAHMNIHKRGANGK